MSLTIFLHNKKPEVDIVRWFRWAGSGGSLAKGPIVTLPLPEFRTTGFDLISKHLEEHRRVSFTTGELNALPDLFVAKTAKQVMDDSDVVQIDGNADEWRLFPMVVRRNSFPRGMEILEKDKERVIPSNCGPDIFWKTFDEVYQFSHWYSV